MNSTFQQYAEHEALAPEPVPQYPSTTDYKIIGGPEYQPVGIEVPNEVLNEKKKKVWGLSPIAAIAVVMISILVVVGIVLGVVFGIKHKNSTPAISYPTDSPASSPTPTGLSIIQAIYGAVNVTERAESVMQEGSYIMFNMSSTSPWSSSAPWNGVPSCLSILHSFGSSIRTFVGCDDEGGFTLVPGNVSLSPNTKEITRQGPSNPSFALVSVVWGHEEIRDEAVYQALYQNKLDGSPVTFSNLMFGKDTWPSVQKTGVIWYTEDNFQTYKSIYARENDTVQF